MFSLPRFRFYRQPFLYFKSNDRFLAAGQMAAIRAFRR